MKRETIPVVLRVGLGLVFAYSGWIKILEAFRFADTVSNFQLLPLMEITLVAIGLPTLELLLGILLVTGFGRRMAALGVILLSWIFFLALGSALWRGTPVACGCFGGGQPAQWKIWFALMRDAFFLSLAVGLYAHNLKRGEFHDYARHSPGND